MSGAGERYVSDADTFQKVVDASYQVPGNKISTGGNAALMGARFSKESCSVFLGGPVGPRLGNLLSPYNIKLLDGQESIDEVIGFANVVCMG
jgi:hypothetical protein